MIFAGAVETVHLPAGCTAGPTGGASPPPLNSTMRVGVGRVTAAPADGVARASAALASTTASAGRIRRMRPPSGAHPGPQLRLVQVTCTLARNRRPHWMPSAGDRLGCLGRRGQGGQVVIDGLQAG